MPDVGEEARDADGARTGVSQLKRLVVLDRSGVSSTTLSIPGKPAERAASYRTRHTR